MKRNILFAILSVFGLLFFVSCQRVDIASPDDFSVTSSKAVYKVGDTVRFNFTGNPDQIVFYSGELGMNYANLNRNIDTSGVVKLVFQSSLQSGVTTNGDSLLLKVSTNLAGYDSTSILKAQWTDITSRNTKWPKIVSPNYITSDTINLSDFKAAESINIAFEYKGKNSASAQQLWKLRRFSLVHNLPDGSNTVLFAAPQISAAAAIDSAFAYVGWVQATTLKNDSLSNAWNVGSANTSASTSLKNFNGVTITSTYPLVFDPGVKVNNPANDDWVITSKVNLKQVKHDFGVPIKSVINSKMTEFDALPSTYFKKPGVYMVSFVAVNQGPTGAKQLVKQVAITVTP